MSETMDNSVRKIFMLDLCSGLGFASLPMRERGWRVITVDIDPRFNPDIVADVTEWSWKGERPDLIWASPPCEEFAREFLPWNRTGKEPDMSVVLACKRIIDECRPRYWVIENVKGAIKYLNPVLGKYAWCSNPYFLWGNIPSLGKLVIKRRYKSSYSSTRPELRAAIPREIAESLANIVEHQVVLPLLEDFQEIGREDS